MRVFFPVYNPRSEPPFLVIHGQRASWETVDTYLAPSLRLPVDFEIPASTYQELMFDKVPHFFAEFTALGGDGRIYCIRNYAALRKYFALPQPPKTKHRIGVPKAKLP